MKTKNKGSPSRLYGLRVLRSPERRALIQRVFERDGHRCVYCGSREGLTVDHLFPVSRGGNNDEENLVTSCSECNQEKGDSIEEASLS
jgi:5-methylcytosine-specific restriction endonuclease McrA